MSTETEYSAGDMRRAAALLAHAAAADTEGMRVIWQEVADSEHGWAGLTGAVIALLFELAPDLKSAGGVAVLQLLAQDWAAWECRDE